MLAFSKTTTRDFTIDTPSFTGEIAESRNMIPALVLLPAVAVLISGWSVEKINATDDKATPSVQAIRRMFRLFAC